MMHTTADDPKKYRSDDDVEPWRKRDPLVRFQKYMKDKGLMTDAEQEKIREQVLEQIQGIVDKAEKRMQELGDPLDMFEHAYAEMPPHLKAQRDYLAAELAEAGKEV